jgi:hypothetical protein
MKKNGFTILLLTALTGVLGFDTPRGWIKAGSHPRQYEAGLDSVTLKAGRYSATLRFVDGEPKGFATLMQQIGVDAYRGKRLRMKGWIKSTNLTGWAGLWLRVDQPGTAASAAFDNMQDRPVRGSSDWRAYDIVLDVPEHASVLAYGVLLQGSGQIWIDGISFEVVGKDVPITQVAKNKLYVLPTMPQNLDFEQ